MTYLVHGLLARAAAEHPRSIAVVDGDRTVTYADLDERANHLARTLVGIGVKRHDRVAVLLDKSIEAVVAQYAAMKAGAAYVPIDPDVPASRATYILRDCAVQCLVTSASRQSTWTAAREAGWRGTVLMAQADGNLPGAIAVDLSAASAPPDVRVVDADPAYIFYTSGSTGQPKGAVLTHRNALTFVEWGAQEFAIGPSDRLASHAPFHFDLSTFDLFVAAHGAAAVVLVPRQASLFPTRLAEFIDSAGITVWYSVPSVFRMLAERGGLARGALPGLRAMLFAGEQLAPEPLQVLMHALPHVTFWNLYGSTEVNCCTGYRLTEPPRSTETIPIGTPLPNYDILLVGDDGLPVGPGQVGEIVVRGSGVMLGYWGDADRTARSFVPVRDLDGIRQVAYRTGDLGRLRADGLYEFLGRRDHQVKTRGFRVELGDVEAALYGHPAVSECCVVARSHELFTNVLEAHVVLRQATRAASLRAFVAGHLPSYMVPDSIVLHDDLPKTSTGKIDRQALTHASVVG